MSRGKSLLSPPLPAALQPEAQPLLCGTNTQSWIKTPTASTCPMCRRDLAVFAIATRICPEGAAAARTMWMDTPADALAVSERL